MSWQDELAQAIADSQEQAAMALVREKMSAGVPAVVTNVGGNIELIEDCVSGYVIQSDSVSQLVAALNEVVSRPEEAALRAEAARAKFEATFSFDAMISAYHDIYIELT